MPGKNKRAPLQRRSREKKRKVVSMHSITQCANSGKYKIVRSGDRWEVYHESDGVIRAGKKQPLFVSDSLLACDSYIERREIRL